MEFVDVIEPPAARQLLQQRPVMAVLAQPIPDQHLENRRRGAAAARDMANKIDIVLVAADRLHRGTQGDGALQVDREGPQPRIRRCREPCADGFVSLFGELKLRRGQLQGFAQPLENADELGLPHD